MPLDCSWLDCRRGGGKMGSGNIETSPLHWSLIHGALVIHGVLVIHVVLVIHGVLVIYVVLVIYGVLVIRGVLVQWQGVEGRMGVRQYWNKYKSIEVLKQVSEHWCRAGWGQAMRDSCLPDTDQGGRSSIATPNIPSKKLPCIETEGGQYGSGSSKEA